MPSNGVPSYMTVLPDGTQTYKGTARTPTPKARPYYVIPGAGPRPRKRPALEDDEVEQQPAAKRLRNDAFSSQSTKVSTPTSVPRTRPISKPTSLLKKTVSKGSVASKAPSRTNATSVSKTTPNSDTTTRSKDTISSKPIDTDQARAAPAPKLSDKPAATQGKTQAKKPTRTHKPLLNDRLFITKKPIITTKPSVANAPSIGKKPDDTKETSTTNKPSITKKPIITNKPSVGSGQVKGLPARKHPLKPQPTPTTSKSRAQKRKSTSGEEGPQPSPKKQRRTEESTQVLSRPTASPLTKNQSPTAEVGKDKSSPVEEPIQSPPKGKRRLRSRKQESAFAAIKKINESQGESQNDTKARRHTQDRTGASRSPTDGDVGEDKTPPSTDRINKGAQKETPSIKPHEAVSNKSNGRLKRKSAGASLDDGTAWTESKSKVDEAPPRRTDQTGGKTKGDSNSNSYPESEGLTPQEKRRRSIEVLRQKALAKQSRKQSNSPDSSSLEPTPQTTPSSSPDHQPDEQKAPLPAPDTTTSRRNSASCSGEDDDDSDDPKQSRQVDPGLPRSKLRRFFKD